VIAGMVLSNLLYVVGAIVAATVVSGFVWLRHRRPKSLEAGIEMFSRELKALEPDRPGDAVRTRPAYGSGGDLPREGSRGRGAGLSRNIPAPGGAGPGQPTTRPGRGPTVNPLAAPRRTDSPEVATGVADQGRNEAGQRSPDREHGSG
jgi:hypothetical protein